LGRIDAVALERRAVEQDRHFHSLGDGGNGRGGRNILHVDVEKLEQGRRAFLSAWRRPAHGPNFFVGTNFLDGKSLVGLRQQSVARPVKHVGQGRSPCERIQFFLDLFGVQSGPQFRVQP